MTYPEAIVKAAEIAADAYRYGHTVQCATAAACLALAIATICTIIYIVTRSAR